MFRRWLQARRERTLHNDRDFECRYWWGDRGGYSIYQERCTICNPIKR